jgi:uncharacterized protein (TIGR03382 family)
MKTAKIAMGVVLAAATTAAAQNLVDIPPHASVYNGFSRGFYFDAQTNFSIVRMDLPMDAFQAGDTAGYLVTVNGVDVMHSIGNSGAIAVNIPISMGDRVEIYGNWSPANPGSFTAHNSYGTGNHATMIEGVPHTLHRAGIQWDIGDPAYASANRITGTTQIGRIFIYTIPTPGTLAMLGLGGLVALRRRR